jgi:hypothetical protein
MNEHSWRELVGEERAVGFDQVADWRGLERYHALVEQGRG